MTTIFKDRFPVMVDGQNIYVHRSGPEPGKSDAPVVVALHGITASGLAWSQVAELLGESVTLLSLDLRGRGESSNHSGPFGIETHADDVIAVCDHVGIKKTILAGHSMGAFVASVCARQHPGRILALVLVDGGLPLTVPTDRSPDQIIEDIVGPAVARLDMSWADREEYHAFWKNHPAFKRSEDWTEYVEEYIDYDMVPQLVPVRSRVSASAVRFDGTELITRNNLSTAAAECKKAFWLLRAPRGILDDPNNPLIPEDEALEFMRLNPGGHFLQIPDVNHYTILMGPKGAAAVADVIRSVSGAE